MMVKTVEWNGKLHPVYEHLGNNKWIAGLYIDRQNAYRAKDQLQKQAEVNVDREDYTYTVGTPMNVMDFYQVAGATRRGE